MRGVRELLTYMEQRSVDVQGVAICCRSGGGGQRSVDVRERGQRAVDVQGGGGRELLTYRGGWQRAVDVRGGGQRAVDVQGNRDILRICNTYKLTTYRY